MKAFVEVSLDGNFANPNFFEAWRGLSYFNYDVTLFKSHDYYTIGIGKTTPVFAGVQTTQKIFKLLNKKAPELPSFPPDLDKFLCRKISEEYLGNCREQVKNGQTWFIKPLDEHRKSFPAFLATNITHFDKIKGLPDWWVVYKSEQIECLAEYRVYVLKGEILDIRKYAGNFKIFPDLKVIEEAVNILGSSPVAYCLDFGVNSDKTFLVEATDAWSFGIYGLDMVHFTNMIVERWKELMGVE